MSIKGPVSLYYTGDLDEDLRTIGEEEVAPMPEEKQSKIFISHSSKDVKYVEKIVDLLISMGVPKDKIFCSSIPGHGIPIGKTIFDFLREQFLNHSLHVLFIHSENYYNSPISLNEMGAAWALQSNYTSLLLPGFSYDKMRGVVNNQEIAIKLDNQDEYELKDKLNQLKAQLAAELDFTPAVGIHWERPRDTFISEIRSTSLSGNDEKHQEGLTTQQEARDEISGQGVESSLLGDITTDDEKIVLYYILKTKSRKITKDSISKWITENEIYGINIDNAFDLLASFGDGTVSGDTLSLDLSLFRKFTACTDNVIFYLEKCVENYRNEAAHTFMALWDKIRDDKKMMLFLLYIIDEQITTLGDRWKADAQIESIEQWENKNGMGHELSSRYAVCLSFFIENNLVYPSEWTSCGNAREYTIYTSLRNLLFDKSNAYMTEITEVRKEW